MSSELGTALEMHGAAVAALETLRATARAQAKGLVEASERRARTGETLILALGREKLAELAPAEVAPLQVDHDAASRDELACTAACNLLVPRLEAAEADVATMAARVRGVAATSAAMLLAKYIDEAHALAPHFAETVALCFELDAMSRCATELAAGENAAPIGAPLYNVVASYGIGFRSGWNGTGYVGPTAGQRATMTPQRLLELLDE